MITLYCLRYNRWCVPRVLFNSRSTKDDQRTVVPVENAGSGSALEVTPIIEARYHGSRNKVDKMFSEKCLWLKMALSNWH